MTERDRLITLRLNEEEHRRFRAVSEDMGLNISAMIRALVREREKTTPPSKKRPKAVSS